MNIRSSARSSAPLRTADEDIALVARNPRHANFLAMADTDYMFPGWRRDATVPYLDRVYDRSRVQGFFRTRRNYYIARARRSFPPRSYRRSAALVSRRRNFPSDISRRISSYLY